MMLDDYLDKPATVKLVTGETLPDGVRFYGWSPLNQEMFWFAIPRPSNPLEHDKEYHIPMSSIALLVIHK